MTRRLLTVVAFALGWIALASPALAQVAPGPAPPPPPGYGGGPPGGYYAPPPPPPGIYRQGLILGFSLGGGSFNCDGCADEDALSGVALDLHIGLMVAPNAAIVLDGWGVSHPVEGGGNVTHVMDTVAVQYFAGPRLWIKGGLGLAQMSINDDRGNTVAESEGGFAMFGAGGYEVYQGQTFALDVQLRAGVANYDHLDSIVMGALTVGFNWY